jgi:hypothetical protein
MDGVGAILRCVETQGSTMEVVREVSKKYLLKSVPLDVVEEELRKKMEERGIPLDFTHVTDEDVERFLKFFDVYLKAEGATKLHELRILDVVSPCTYKWYLGVADVEYALWLPGDFFDVVRTPIVFYVPERHVDHVLNSKSLLEGAKIVKKFLSLPSLPGGWGGTFR